MKPTLLILLLAGLFTSCTEYQYLTVSGINISKNEKSNLVSENDTLRVEYQFANYKGQIGITVFNKTNQPLEIDWKRSAVIIDGKALSYFSPTAIIAATVEKDSLRWQNRFLGFRDPAYIASLNGSVFINEPTQFIPPLSFIYKVPLALPVEPFQNLPEQQATKEVAKKTIDTDVSYQKLTFDKATSPLLFRSYLTFRIGGTGAQKEFTVEHNFYISEIWKTKFDPESFPNQMIERGDRFYL